MNSSTYAIVLAAGSASRFGSTKQLATLDGTTLVARACGLAGSVCGDRTLLVTGTDHLAVLRATRMERGFIAYNERHASGLASSIACGVRAVARLADHVLLLLADQPLITTGHLQDLLRACETSKNALIATAFAGTVGPPAIFPSALFAELRNLQGDQGARSLLDDNEDRLIVVPFEDAVVDIDRPEDLGNFH